VIMNSPSKSLEVVRTANNSNATDFINLENGNPSVLARPRPDHGNCTHHLFRAPKSGSTALYNAVMSDTYLHRFVCWTRRRLFNATARQPLWHPLPPRVVAISWHAPPVRPWLPQYPWPILVTLRHPQDLLMSRLTYFGGGGWKSNDSTPVQGPSHVQPSMFKAWVPVRTDPARAARDVYLCMDDSRRCPDLAEQLRRTFREPRIQPIPLENVNHRKREVIFAEGTDLSSYIAAEDLKIWKRKCGNVCSSSAIQKGVHLG